MLVSVKPGARDLTLESIPAEHGCQRDRVVEAVMRQWRVLGWGGLAKSGGTGSVPRVSERAAPATLEGLLPH